MNNFPKNVQNDLSSGFILTDQDDGFQRCKPLSETVFQYRCNYDGELFDETIDVDTIDKDQTISGFYNSVEAVVEEFGKNANMILAECEFEHRVAVR